MAVQLYNISEEKISVIPRRFERKFYIPPTSLGTAYGLLHHTCALAKEYPSEQINSLYFDTPDLEQYEKSESGDYEKDKVRIRWYGKNGNEPGTKTVFLELKSRRGFAGFKQRLKLQVPVEKLEESNLPGGIIPYPLIQKALAKFGFFPSNILIPVIQISYWRYRFVDILTNQSVSLDVRISSQSVFPALYHLHRYIELPGGVIEVKGQTNEMSPALAELNILGIDWSRFSKYSACIDAHVEKPGSTGFLSPSGRVLSY